MCMFTKEENKKTRDFEIAMKMRDFEIGQLTNRNNFFMIFQGVLFAGILQSTHEKPIISFMACLVGLVVSIFQVRMASGAKFWQEYWEQMLSEYERDMRSGSPVLFHEDNCKYSKTVKDRLMKRGFSGLASELVMRRFSVSRIPIHVGIALSIIWGLLLLSTLRACPLFSIPNFIIGF